MRPCDGAGDGGWQTKVPRSPARIGPQDVPPQGVAGGGGNGGALGQTATSGMIHTGSGGGSVSNENPPPVPAGSGGSGIVIIRYAL